VRKSTHLKGVMKAYVDTFPLSEGNSHKEKQLPNNESKRHVTTVPSMEATGNKTALGEIKRTRK
jgi:hypothetical protein